MEFGRLMDWAELINPKTAKKLADIGITELFPVQQTLLPFLLEKRYRNVYVPYDPPPDACISAPTGSGKTLAYVIPIVELLSARVVTRLRALIVLPTRDLVVQVRETFEAVAKGHGLKIATATGQHSFSHEQAQLVADSSHSLLGGSSKVDVLICTPGRLIDHIHYTPNFTLQHLRFLVIDEADRLLAQSFQDWLSQVTLAIDPPNSAKASPPDLTTPYPDALSPSHMSLLPSYKDSFPCELPTSSCQKLLFSATLPNDPGKLSKLGLRNVQYFFIGTSASPQDANQEGTDASLDKFVFPSTLKEKMIICETSDKPLLFYHMILNLKIRDSLVFTKSVESAERLVRLWTFFSNAISIQGHHALNDDVSVVAFTSDLSPVVRRDVLERFKRKEISVLICSDIISRGIDISHVSHVISYDIPLDLRKYVHRVGRTARAGREGEAWSLVETQEAKWFKRMMKNADRSSALSTVQINPQDIDPLKEAFMIALEKLKDYYARE